MQNVCTRRSTIDHPQTSRAAFRLHEPGVRGIEAGSLLPFQLHPDNLSRLRFHPMQLKDPLCDIHTDHSSLHLWTLPVTCGHVEAVGAGGSFSPCLACLGFVKAEASIPFPAALAAVEALRCLAQVGLELQPQTFDDGHQNSGS